MYKWILTAIAACGFLWGMSQPNNPYNQNGVDYVKSLEIIQKDFASGKLKDFDEASLQSYSRAVQLKNEVSATLAGKVLGGVKSLSPAAIIGNSGLSAASKQIMLDVAGAASLARDPRSWKKYLEGKVETVLKAVMPREEQVFILSQLAVVYNLSGVTARNGCYIDTPQYHGPATGGPCIAMGAILGGIVGFTLCGIWCAMGGALIGGIMGALS